MAKNSAREEGRRQNIWIRLFSTALVAIGSVVIIIPLLWMISTSLKTVGNVFSIPPEFIPRETDIISVDGRNYVLYDVVIEGETKTLAMVRLHPERSEFFDPDNPSVRYYAPARDASRHRVVRLRWENYITVWTFESAPFYRYLLNTVFYVALSTFGSLLANSFVAYGFARLRGPGRNVLFVGVLSTMMIPVYATIIPQYVLWARQIPEVLSALFGVNVKLVDTYWPLILPSFFGSAYEIFLLRQFFSTIPRDYDEAARMDGAGYVRIWGQVILPMSRPVLLAVGMIDVMFYWNEYFYPLIYLNSTDRLPLSVGLATFQSFYAVSGPPPYHLIMAAALISLLPLVIIFFALNRYFIQGVVVSGLKG